MVQPGRKYQTGTASYRYSINGQEKDSELNENITTALYWEYDSRIGRRWNIDPVVKPWESPYSCFNNSPIIFVDIDGDDAGKKKRKETSTVDNPKKLKEVVVVADRKAKRNTYSYQPIKPSVGLDGVSVKFYAPEPVLKQDLGMFNLNYQPPPNQNKFNVSNFLETAGTNLEHSEKLVAGFGLENVSKKISVAGTVTSGVSIVNNLAHKNWWEAGKDGAELIVGKTVAAPYYYTGKTFIEVFAGKTTMSNAYYAFEQEKRVLINNFKFYRQQGDEKQVEKITKKLIQIENAQGNILNSLRANQEN